MLLHFIDHWQFQHIFIHSDPPPQHSIPSPPTPHITIPHTSTPHPHPKSACFVAIWRGLVLVGFTHILNPRRSIPRQTNKKKSTGTIRGIYPRGNWHFIDTIKQTISLDNTFPALPVALKKITQQKQNNSVASVLHTLFSGGIVYCQVVLSHKAEELQSTCTETVMLHF